MWQPIETAPEEGQFLVYDRSKNFYYVFDHLHVRCDLKKGSYWTQLPEPPKKEALPSIRESLAEIAKHFKKLYTSK